MIQKVAATEPVPRTYGNWRKPSSPGLPRLGLLGTVAALGSLVLVMLVQITLGLLAAAVVAVVVLVGLAPLAWRDRAGRNGCQVLLARASWRLGRRRRQHLYSSSLTGPVSFGAARLPGLLATSSLLSAVTAHGEPFALLHLPSSRQYAVLICCDPEGAGLVDPETVDEWVACWGGWLARLGHEANLDACTVTVETAPDPGGRLDAEVQAMLTPDAPTLSRAMLTEAAASYPRGAATVSAYVTLTFSARRTPHTDGHSSGRARGGSDNGTSGAGGASVGNRVRGSQEMAAQIGRRLPLLLHQLRAAGAGTGRAMTAAEVAETVRVAYDPAASALLDRARAQQPPDDADAAARPPLVSWQDAGPVAQVEAWDHLRHDSAASITWQMVDVPHGAVTSRILEQLLAADPQLARKRVTLIYRPHDAASAARVADADVRTAIGNATRRAGEGRATESLALASARQSAAEQAAGAGLVRFSMLVTATVLNPAGGVDATGGPTNGGCDGGDDDGHAVEVAGRLAQAAAVVEQLGPACQLRLRRCYFAQSAAFAAALGVGVVLPHHVTVPDMVRDNL